MKRLTITLTALALMALAVGLTLTFTGGETRADDHRGPCHQSRGDGNWDLQRTHFLRNICPSITFDGHYAYFYKVTDLDRYTRITLSVTSETIDTYLILHRGTIDGQNTIILQDDDGGSGTNSRLTVTLAPGDYFFEMTSFGMGTTGRLQAHYTSSTVTRPTPTPTPRPTRIPRPPVTATPVPDTPSSPYPHMVSAGDDKVCRLSFNRVSCARVGENGQVRGFWSTVLPAYPNDHWVHIDTGETFVCGIRRSGATQCGNIP